MLSILIGVLDDLLTSSIYTIYRIALQDIHIRIIDNEPTGNILIEYEARNNVYKLEKLAWRFAAPTHLHRVGLEPLSELPFL